MLSTPPADYVNSPLTKGGERGNILRLTPPLRRGAREEIFFIPPDKFPHSPPNKTLPFLPDKILPFPP